MPGDIKSVNIHEAKTQLSRLLEDVRRGEKVIIAKAGRPIARMIAYSEEEAPKPKRLGFLAGEISVPDDFDCLGADVIEHLFTGER